MMGKNTLIATSKEKPDILRFQFSETESDFSESTTSNKKYFTLKCPTCQGIFKAQLRSLAATEKNCPYCHNRKVLPGFNDLETLFPKIAKEYCDDNLLPAGQMLAGSTIVTKWLCSSCQNVFSMRIISRTREGQGCPKCKGWRGPKKEKKTIALAHPELITLWDYTLNPLPPEKSPSNLTKHWWLCPKGHSYFANPYRAKKGSCSVCHGKQISIGVNDFKSKADKNILKEWDYSKNKKGPHEYTYGSNAVVWWICEESHSFTMEVGRRCKRKDRCPECRKEDFVSMGERELALYLENNNFVIETQNRTVIKPFEIDILIPYLQVGIEYNGDFWHSDQWLKKTHKKTAKQYHSMKKKLCADANIILIFIWESDWKNNRKEVEEALILLLNTGELSPTLTKLEGPLDAPEKYNAYRA